MNYINRKDYLVGVFSDTVRRIDFGGNLTDVIAKSTASQQYYIGDSLNVVLDRKNETEVVVTQLRTFEAAAKHIGLKTAVLNFASATTPGGGVEKGASAQEECLCRVSTLYPCLKSKKAWDLFYHPHRIQENPLHNNDVIYTPNVVVFKDDDYNLLQDWFTVNVITCAAPNLREKPSNSYNKHDGEHVSITDQELLELHKSRARKILSVAAENNNEVVVLGAFGCGVFMNPPTVVATAYKLVLPEFKGVFKIVEFAVYCPTSDKRNYEAFKMLKTLKMN